MEDELELSNRIRHACLHWLRLHRRDCADPGCVEPANFLAYLAHSMGLDDLDHMRLHFLEYEVGCEKDGEKGDCPHGK
jgi:hypothetical protein